MSNKSRILIIDDDPDQILMYQVEFETHGFDVITAATANDGIAQAKKGKPDAILLDVYMEGKNGLEALKELKRDSGTKDIPVLVFTNFGRKEFEREAKELGAAKYIPKTSRVPRQLVDDVCQVLEIRASGGKHAKQRKEKILLVEDNPFHRQMYTTKFNKSGFLLVTAINGEEGLKQAQSGDIDLILLDLALPGISGVDVLKKLKSNDATKNIPVVVFTVTPRDDLPHDVRDVIDEYIVAYFEKLTQMPGEAVKLVDAILKEKGSVHG